MTTLDGIRLVATRELTERVRTRAFVISTAVMTVVVTGLVLLPALLDSGGRPSYRLGIVDSGSSVPGESGVSATLRTIGRTAGAEVHVRSFVDRAAAVRAVRRGEIDLAVVPGSALVVKERPDDDTALARVAAGTSQVLSLQERLAASGLAPDAVVRALDAPPLPVRSLERADPDRDEKRGVAFGGIVLLFIAILTYGSWIATGVVEEKSTRIVEMLLSTMRPGTLLAGKVVGIGLAGLTQLACVVVPAVIAAIAVGSDLPNGTPVVIGAVLVSFVFGFAFYCCAYAGAGALTSRVEDAQSATFPITALLMVGYFATTFTEPESTLCRVLSFLPPTAPLAMLLRVAVGDAAPWEVGLAMLSTVAGTIVVVRLAAHVYEGSVLRTGTKLSLRQAWSARD